MRSENAAQMLLEADARFFSCMGGIGIQGEEKILDFLPYLGITPHDIPWLDMSVHFRLHSQLSPQRPGFTFQAVTLHLLQ